VPVAVAVCAAALLAGCSSASSSTSTATPAAKSACTPPKSGSVSDAVQVSGAKGVEPTVTFSKPLTATSVQRSTAISGDGAKAAPGSLIDVAVVAYDGRTGAKLTSNGYSGTAPIPLTVGDTTMIPGLTDAVECATVGSRLVTTGTAKQLWGGADPTSLSGLKSTDSVVFVVDVLDSVPLKADGASQTPKAGFPAVKLASDGTPTITIPKTKAPTSTQVELLKKGSGAAVGANDTVTIQYQGVNWRTGKVFDQTWGKQPYTGVASGFVAGFTQAIVGQTVGSQVLVVIPPAAGYGSSGQPSAGIKGTDDMVFVIDILKAES
jgi:peptidylprolyl isomerase